MNRNRFSSISDRKVVAAQRGAATIRGAAFVLAATVVIALALAPHRSEPARGEAAPEVPSAGAAEPAGTASRLDYRIEQPPSSGSEDLHIDQGSVHG